MSTNPNIFPLDGKEYIEEISANGVFEKNITQWIEDCKSGSLSREDILNVTQKVAKYRNTPTLVEEIMQRFN